MDYRSVGVVLLGCVAAVFAAGGGSEADENFPNYGIATPAAKHDPDNECASSVEQCKSFNGPQLAYNSLPVTVYSKAEYNQYCKENTFQKCLKQINKEETECTRLQGYDISGQIMAEQYVCSEDGKKEYSPSEAEQQALDSWYVDEENRMCDQKFLAFSYQYFEEAEHILEELDLLGDDASGHDKLDIQKRAKDQYQKYCNYMYAYQDCVEAAAQRHGGVGHWQYDMVKNYYTPHFERAGCHIGKGLEAVTIAAIVIVAVILTVIFSLAAFCGVYEKCFEKCRRCRNNHSKRTSDDEDKLRPVDV